MIENNDVELWRLPKVLAVTGLSRDTIRLKMNAGTFPQSRQIGANSVAWLSTEVREWITALPVAASIAA